MKIVDCKIGMSVGAYSKTHGVITGELVDLIEDGVDEYEITDYIIETIQDQEVFGWIDGVNRFGKPVKRTYMLVPE